MQRNTEKTTQWERLEISSRKLEIPRKHSCKDGHNKEQKWYRPNRNKRYLVEVARIHRRTTQKDLYDPDNHDGVTSTQSQTS